MQSVGWSLTTQCNTALFADDTAIFTQSWRIDTIARRLSRAIHRFYIYFSRWRMKVNIDKSAAIVFSKHRATRPTTITMEGVEVPWTPVYTNSQLLITYPKVGAQSNRHIGQHIPPAGKRIYTFDGNKTPSL
jgi:hypothetical protein